MSVGRRTPGRRNSWVIQIQPPPPLSLSLVFCRCFFSFFALTRGGSLPPTAPRLPLPSVPAEALNPTPELPAARPIHQTRPSLSSVLWTNEPGVWRRTRCVCHVSVHSGGGGRWWASVCVCVSRGVGGLYLLQTRHDT